MDQQRLSGLKFYSLGFVLKDKKLDEDIIDVDPIEDFVLDDGKERVELLLDNPAQGLLIESFMWREMYEFSDDCVLMVLADQHYDESDYVRDYNDFLKQAKGSA